MKRTLLACALLSASMAVAAKDQLITLSEADATALHGKTLALTLHERPTFIAMTAGKATFALLGVGAMAVAGNKLIDDNHVADPAGLIRTSLSDLLRDVDGMQPMAVDATPTKAEKPAQIAATHPEADYVLDVRSGGWNYVYFPAQWGHYWVGYSVQVQLIDTKSSRQVSNAACNTNTHANPNPPSREQLDGDGAKLLKDVTAGLGWMCVQLLAKDQLRIPTGKLPITPVEYVDPLAALAKATAPAAAPAPASAAAAPAAGPSQTVPAMGATDKPARPTASPVEAPASH